MTQIINFILIWEFAFIYLTILNLRINDINLRIDYTVWGGLLKGGRINTGGCKLTLYLRWMRTPLRYTANWYWTDLSLGCEPLRKETFTIWGIFLSPWVFLGLGLLFTVRNQDVNSDFLFIYSPGFIPQSPLVGKTNQTIKNFLNRLRPLSTLLI